MFVTINQSLFNGSNKPTGKLNFLAISLGLLRLFISFFLRADVSREAFFFSLPKEFYELSFLIFPRILFFLNWGSGAMWEELVDLECVFYHG